MIMKLWQFDDELRKSMDLTAKTGRAAKAALLFYDHI